MSPKKTYIRRNGSSAAFQFLMRVPQRVLPRVKGRTILISLPPSHDEGPVMVRTTIGTVVKFSLRTRNRETAEAREAVARFELLKIFNAAQKGPASISQRQRAALAGCVYELFADAFGENPGTPDKWAAWKAFNRAAGEGRITSAAAISTEPFDEIQAAKDRFGDNLTAGINSLPRTETFEGLEARFGAVANWVLARHDLEINADTRKALLIDIYRAAQDVGFRLKKNAGGDYRADPEEEKFPKFEKAPQITLSDLFERWRAEGRPAPSTVSTWRGAIRLFKLHLGHENARAITTEDVIAFKDALVAKGRTAKTINDSTLTALRAIFNFAVRDKLLSSNPALGVKVLARAAPGSRQLPYEDEEVARLLRLAERQTDPRRRWLIPLAALTGARIGELAQLWGESVRVEGGVHFLEIRPAPDGGTLKNIHSERSVPLHPALIDAGFLDFVKARGKGPLFYRKSSGDPTKKHASKGVTNHLAEWIRAQGFEDERKAPNHAFRHWWKTTLARVGVQDSVADDLQGHAGRTVASTYRHFDLKTLAGAIARIPVPVEKSPPDDVT